MRAPEESRGRPATERDVGPAPTSHTLALSATQPLGHSDSSVPDSRVVLAHALVAVPPAADRRLWLLLVRCPYCTTRGVTSVHAHRAADVAGNLRRAGCGRGVYAITVGAS